ncbi:unnamed protein product [Clonostachys rosea]|uniref:DUF7924 domain-containing protein n=1 Tax=Bionectria ochroleuca TaxID=29856 RepID=A0ABY6UPB1_BIOOC|nr:unnamed protein product [Clonostachys rosea]
MKEEDEFKKNIQLVDELRPPDEFKNPHSERGNGEASRPSLKPALPFAPDAPRSRWYCNIYLNKQSLKPFGRNPLDNMNHPEGSGTQSAGCNLKEESEQWVQILTHFQHSEIETQFSDLMFYVRNFQHARGSTASLIRALITPALVPRILHTPTTRQEIKNLAQVSNPIMTGFDIKAFPEEHMRALSEHFCSYGQLAALRPATLVYFPFLLCEVASSQESLNLAELRNIQSAGTIIQGLVTLFDTADQLELLNRNIIVFSLAHNDTFARVMGHFPVIEDGVVKHREHHLMTDDISVEAGKCHRFIRHLVEKLYMEWSPRYLLLIQGALAAVVNSWEHTPEQSHLHDQMKVGPSEE